MDGFEKIKVYLLSKEKFYGSLIVKKSMIKRMSMFLRFGIDWELNGKLSRFSLKMCCFVARRCVCKI